MRTIFNLLCCLFSLPVLATNYYVDPSTSMAEEKGSILAPWKGFELLHKAMPYFKAGDTVFLKRGELYFEKLDVRCSGSAAAPIVFTAYGEGKTKPILMYKAPVSEKIKSEPHAIRILKSKFVHFVDLEITDDHIDPNDHHAVSLIKIAFSIAESNNITIRNCKISKVGIGVNIIGDNNLVDRCDIRNLRMVRNTEGGYDDYGANAVVIAGSNNVISHSHFEDCWAYSYDFEFDGGAVEMFGANINGNTIKGNTVVNCNGFMEFGSDAGGVCRNNTIIDNLIINCGDLLYINNDGPYAVNVQSLLIRNNSIIQAFEQFTRSKYMLSMAKAAAVADGTIVELQNNVLWMSNGISLLKPAQFGSQHLLHANNTFYLKGGQLNMPLARTDKLLNDHSELLKKTPKGTLLAGKMDFFPMKYLLKYWYLIF